MMRKGKFLLLLTVAIILITSLYNNPQIGLNSRSAYGQQPYIYHFPIFYKLDSIYTSTSYYMTTLNNGVIYNLGCQLGIRDKNAPGTQNSVAVLAFGYPRCFTEGGYGANLFGYGPASTTNVSNAIKQFALGYYACTGSDKTSNLVIGAGTSNYLGGKEPCDSLAKSTAHGAAWSGMVRDLNQFAVNQGIFHQVQIYGANDIEIGWNSPAWTRAWLSGFEQVSGNLMLYFGDAAGCPYEDKPHWSCGSYPYTEWTQEDVWYLSYGAPSALPLPLIYLTNGVHAKQWTYLSRYSVLEHGYRMEITGVFTQWAACQQFGGCSGIDNTPEMAYQQLSYELGKWPATAQFIPWKTDIRWILQSEISSIAGDDSEGETSIHPAQAWVENLESALQSSEISPTLRSSLMTKQDAFQKIVEMASISQIMAFPKEDLIASLVAENQPVTFFSGIIERGEIPGLPYGAQINQVWQAVTESGYLQIGAGSTPEGTMQGALYIVLASPDHTSFQSKFIEAPSGCGSLSILDETDGFLTIQSANGCQFLFDLYEWNLLAIP